MLELIKRTFLTGVGLAALTKDKVEEQAKKIAEELKLDEQEGRKLADDLLRQAEQSREKLTSQVKQMVKKTLQELHLPSREDLERIEKRLEELEKGKAGQQAKS